MHFLPVLPWPWTNVSVSCRGGPLSCNIRFALKAVPSPIPAPADGGRYGQLLRLLCAVMRESQTDERQVTTKATA